MEMIKEKREKNLTQNQISKENQKPFTKQMKWIPSAH